MLHVLNLSLLLIVGYCMMSDNHVEQRSVIKFLAQTGNAPMDIWRQLQAVHGQSTLSPKSVRVWVKKFLNGRVLVKDKKRSGRPKSVRTQPNIDRVGAVVLQDRRATLDDISEATALSRSSVHCIIKKDLTLSKLSPKFVPRLLSDEQKDFRRRMCELNIQSLKEDNNFLSRIVTGDETWVSTFEIELKKDSKEWHKKGAHAECPMKALRNRSTRKVMLTVFMTRRAWSALTFCHQEKLLTVTIIVKF